MLFRGYVIMAYMSRPFNTREAAARLSVSESTVQRLFRRHQLQGLRLGRALRFTEKDILTFIERHREEVVRPEQQTRIFSPQTPKISLT